MCSKMMYFIWIGLMLVLSTCAATQPNIVLIVADDLGWNDVSMHGADQIPTPNIDALGFSGVLLRRHYVLPTCTPSRAALMTGRYPIRTGMQGTPLKAGEPRALDVGVRLLPQYLKDLGYTTRMIGKWHLGSMDAVYTPTKRGFDSHFGYWNGYIDYFNHNLEQNVPSLNEVFYGHDFRRNLEVDWDSDGSYVTSLFTEEAQKLIKGHNHTNPLFLYVSHLAVHSGAYDKLQVPSEEQARKIFNYIEDPDRRLYAEMVRQLDDSVGHIVRALNEADMLNNTIIVFMSDNGGMTEGIHKNKGSNWPFRGIKFTLFEGGVHGVAAVWSPLLQTRRRIMPTLMHITDWLPTLYRAAGGNPSTLADLDGIDQWEQIIGSSEQSPRQEVLVNIDERTNASAIISDHWKLVLGTWLSGAYDGYLGDSGRNESYPAFNAVSVVEAASNMGIDLELDKEIVLKLRREATMSCGGLINTLGTPPCLDHCLFNLDEDPCETTDVSSSNSEIAQQLQERLDYFKTQLVPQLNQAVDVRSNPVYFNNTWETWLDNVDTGYCNSITLKVT